MSAVLERFARAKDASFFPVVNELGEPIGIVKESALRGYAYSVYGRDLIRNPSLRGMLRTLVDRCPIADVNMSAERILELFSLDPSSDGLLLTSGLRYAGFLSASSLLQIVHEKNLVAARDGVLRVMEKFGDDVASLYTPEDRQRGWVESRARNGDLRKYPLLRVSAAVLHLPPGPPRGSIDGVIGLISAMKKEAKASSSGLATAVLDVGGNLVPTPSPP